MGARPGPRRGFWILDNITPLRQLQTSIAKSPAYVFRPQTALRVRWNTNSDTPLPPDVAAGENPPDGAMIDYYLGPATTGPMTLEINDEAGKLVRRYSSADPLPTPDPTLNIPSYWVRPPQKLASEPGLHRFLWDFHYAPVPGVRPDYPIAAVYRNTAPAPTSPWTMPGKYTVVLTVNGRKYSQELIVQMDPRVKASTADLAEQFRLSKELYDEWLILSSISESAGTIRKRLLDLRPRVPDGDVKARVDALSEKLQALSGTGGGGPGGFGAAAGRLSIASETGRVRALFNIIEGVDAAPSQAVANAVPDVIKDSRTLQANWETIKSQEIPALNQQLRAAGLPAIEISR